MNNTLICNNKQGFPKFLLINCVWNNYKPEIEDVVKFLFLISLIEEIDYSNLNILMIYLNI